MVLPPGSTAASPFRLRDLAALPLVAAPPGSSTRGLLDDSLRRSAVTATVVVEAAQREALLPLIVAGAGAGLLPRPLADVAAHPRLRGRRAAPQGLAGGRAHPSKRAPHIRRIPVRRAGAGAGRLTQAGTLSALEGAG